MLTKPALWLAVLGLIAVGASATAWHHHQHDKAKQTAAAEANRLAQATASELTQQINQQRQRLQQATSSSDPQLSEADNSRLFTVTDERSDPAALSFTLRELLQRLRRQGGVVMSSRGGDQPALLMAHSVPKGALILERDLTPWRDQLRQQLPAAAAVTLRHDNLTLIRQGHSDATNAITATATSGPFTVTLSVTPPTLSWRRLLAPAGGAALLVLLMAYGVHRVRTKRSPPSHVETLPVAASEPSSEPEAPTDLPAAPPPKPDPEPGPAPPADLFGPYGIRAPDGEPLDLNTLEQLGRAIGSEASAAGQNTLFVVHTSAASDDAAQVIVQGLTACGCQVANLGLAPSSALHYAIAVLESHSGVCVGDGGASLEIVINGEPLLEENLTALRQRLLDGALEDGSGAQENRDIRDRYLAAIADDIILARPLSVAIQGSDAAAEWAPTLFNELGCKVVSVNHDQDSAALATTVTEQQLDLGLAFPATGGLALVASDGEWISADRLLMLCARDLLERNPGADVLFDVKCSRALANVIRKQGGRPWMEHSAPSYLQARRRELAAPLVGGASGHIGFADRWYGFSDALYAGARLAEILSLQSGDSSAVFAALSTGSKSPVFDLAVGAERRSAIMAGLRERAERFPGGRVTILDGLRVDFPDGWGLVSEANHHSDVLEVHFEGRDAAALERVQALFHDQFRGLDNTLELPF